MGDHIHILSVEDDESLLFGISFALQREGWTVTSVSTLEGASTSLQSGVYDLVLLDNQLPDGRGIDFCRKVRHESGIPIIFLTASDEEVNIVQGLENGADDYITKPFRVQELISRIRAVLRRYEVGTTSRSGGVGESLPVLISNGITVHLMERRVLVADREIFLSPTEFMLLITLMQHPRQILTRQLILQKLWDSNGEFIDDNTLSVHIRRLREKVEPNPSCPIHIITVRGVGYKWQTGS